MEQRVGNLIYILRGMVEAFEGLLSAATAKQEQIVSCDIGRLDKTIKEEVELLDHIILLEEQSGTILHEINRAFFNTNTLVLGELVLLCKNGGYDGHIELSNVYARLKELTMRLKDINEQNQSLARFSIQIIRDTVRFICKEARDAATYKRSGRIETAESLLNIVDTQI